MHLFIVCFVPVRIHPARFQTAGRFHRSQWPPANPPLPPENRIGKQKFKSQRSISIYIQHKGWNSIRWYASIYMVHAYINAEEVGVTVCIETMLLLHSLATKRKKVLFYKVYIL
jgi:nitroreductase